MNAIILIVPLVKKIINTDDSLLPEEIETNFS